MEIEVHSVIPHHVHDWFSINLCQGPQMEPTSPLHFNVRLDDHYVVLNAMEHGAWGGEDRKSDEQFHRGKAFDIRIIVRPQMYEIKVNGRHIADFPHRMPKQYGQFIIIKGAVSINYITFNSKHHGGGCCPGGDFAPPQPAGAFVPPSFPYPTGAVPAPQPSYGPIFNPPVPFVSGIPGGMAPGKMITISGIPFLNHSRFSINLQSASYEGCDVAFHCDVRFQTNDGSVNTIVRNHCQGGSWGQEERGAPYFPFMPNANFDILILVEPQAFKVAMNNQHLLEFRHRLPVQAAKPLKVSGDVRLTQVRFQ
ncbi:hypothetical protein ACOMHN_025195 [Nucella lapillus]